MKIACGSLLAAVARAALTAAAQQKLTLHHHDAAHEPPGTIVVPASDFFDDIPEGDSAIGGRAFPAGDGVVLQQRHDQRWGSPRCGYGEGSGEGGGDVYHLFVRASGQDARQRVRSACDRRQAGCGAPLGRGRWGWQRGGDFTLKAGTVEIRLTAIQPRPSFNVLVLTKNADFKEDDLKALELPPEVKLLHEYKIQALEHCEVRRCGRLGQVRDPWIF
jgi:hypothetical protein